MNKWINFLVLTLLLFYIGPLTSTALAYELATHGTLTYQALQRSALKDSSLFKDLGIERNIQVNPDEPFGISYYDVSGETVRERTRDGFEGGIIQEFNVQPLSLQGWLMRGAIREDDLGFLFGSPYGEDPHDDPYGPIWRVMHHFYDPVHDRPLIISSTCRTLFETTTGETADFHRSPDWASGARDAFNEPNTPLVNRRNHFTILDAREAMYSALTGKNNDGADIATTDEERSRYWATLFRSLGDIVHHIQDMGQPRQSSRWRSSS